jgi:hypothetical protein
MRGAEEREGTWVIDSLVIICTLGFGDWCLAYCDTLGKHDKG